MENLLSNQSIRKQYSHFLDCDWPSMKFLYFATSAIFTSAFYSIQFIIACACMRGKLLVVSDWLIKGGGAKGFAKGGGIVEKITTILRE